MPPSPSPIFGVHPDSCASSQWCHPAIPNSYCPLLFLPPIPPSIRVFSNESPLHIRWPKDWSFSFSNSPSVNIQGWVSLGLADLISLHSKREGTHVYLWLIHIAVWQKPTQHYKVIIFQLKINKFKRKITLLINAKKREKNLLQHHDLKASILWCSAFFMVQFSHVRDYWNNRSLDCTDLC